MQYTEEFIRTVVQAHMGWSQEVMDTQPDYQIHRLYDIIQLQDFRLRNCIVQGNKAIIEVMAKIWGKKRRGSR